MTKGVPTAIAKMLVKSAKINAKGQPNVPMQIATIDIRGRDDGNL